MHTLAVSYIKPAEGLSAADRATAREWMVEEHELLHGRVQGTIPTRGAATITPGTTDQTIPAGLYLNGEQTIAGDAKYPRTSAAGPAFSGWRGQSYP